MKTRLPFVWPIPSLRVAYAASAEPQELRITLRGSPPGRNIGHWGLKLGFIGGAEFAPWLTRWEEQTPWPRPSADAGLGRVYLAKVSGMSHRFVPHLVARIAMSMPAGSVLEHLEIIGSAPLADSAMRVTEADVTPWLADLAMYPQQWPELGFPVEHAASAEHELGVQIEVARDFDASTSEALKFRFMSPDQLFLSLANDKGDLMAPPKAMGKHFPVLLKGRLAQAYIGNMRHAHAPSSALWLNMLSQFHHQVAPIARVRLTSRQTPRAAGAKQPKENWVSWQFEKWPTGTPSPRRSTPESVATAPLEPVFVGAVPYRTLAQGDAHLGDRVPSGGQLASDADGPTLYAVLRGDLYLEPLVPADAERMRKATALLAAALGEHLRYAVNSKRGEKVVRYQARHFAEIIDWIPSLTGTSEAGSKAMLRKMLAGDFDGADVSFKGASEGDDPAASASPWTVAFGAELAQDDGDDPPRAFARLTFSVPLDFPLARFEALFAEVAAVLRVRWGIAGFGYATWEYFGGGVPPARAHADAHAGFDIGAGEGTLSAVQQQLRSISWLTLLGAAFWARVPETEQTALIERFTPMLVGDTVLLRASEQPEIDKTEGYMALDSLLRSIRLRGGIADDVWSEAEIAAWLARFERRDAAPRVGPRSP